MIKLEYLDLGVTLGVSNRRFIYEFMNFLRPSRYSLPESQVTPEAIFWNRREFLRG